MTAHQERGATASSYRWAEAIRFGVCLVGIRLVFPAGLVGDALHIGSKAIAAFLAGTLAWLVIASWPQHPVWRVTAGAGAGAASEVLRWFLDGPIVWHLRHGGTPREFANSVVNTAVHRTHELGSTPSAWLLSMLVLPLIVAGVGAALAAVSLIVGRRAAPVGTERSAV